METTQEKPRPSCPECKSKQVSKYGFKITRYVMRSNKQAVKNQVYQCQTCGHRFYENQGNVKHHVFGEAGIGVLAERRHDGKWRKVIR